MMCLYSPFYDLLQEKVINLEMEEIQWRLQRIAVMDDSQKTEEDRNQEQVKGLYLSTLKMF